MGDVNNDGHRDLVTIRSDSPRYRLTALLGNSDGTFQPQLDSASSAADPSTVTLGDFDNDGTLDVISTRYPSASFFKGNGTGTFILGADPYNGTNGCGGGAAVVGDFDGNGKLDFATANAGCGTVSVYLGNGNGTFLPRVDFAVGNNQPNAIAVADLDGDGKLDLVTSDYDGNNATGGVSILRNTTPTGGALSFALTGPTGPRSNLVAVADVNGDGKRDLVGKETAQFGSNRAFVMLNTTPAGSGAFTFAPAVFYSASASAGDGILSLEIVDTNQDGFRDIVVGDQTTKAANVLLNNGDGTFGLPIAFNTNSTGDLVVAHDASGGTLDFNGDGEPDLATISSAIGVLLGTPPPSIQAVYGDNQQMLKSPVGTFSGIPFQLVAGIVDGHGAPLPATAVTFTVNGVGGVGGRFIAADPNSTTLSVTTKDGTNGTYAGMTDTIDLYPASAAGQFTVTATAAVDGAALSATYTLTILASLPTPTINAVLPASATNATQQGPKTNAVTAQPAGLIPPLIIIDPNQSYNIFVNGSGFVKQSYTSQTNPPNPSEHIAAFFTRNPLSIDYPSVAMDVVYISSTQLLVRVDGPTMLAGLSAATTANINIYNPESSPGANDRGISNPVFLTLSLPSPAPTGSKIVSSGATSVLAAPGLPIVLPPVQVIDAQDHPLPGSVDGKAPSLTRPNGGGLVASGGGNIVASGGGNLVASGGGNLVASGGGNVIQNHGGNLVASGGGNIANDAGKPAAPSTVARVTQTGAVGSAPKRTVANPSVASDYITSTDANSIIMAAPVFSNGIPGTFTRTLSVDGIAAPVTYTITNLNPHDGHPMTITHLSRTGATVGAPAFTLTVAGSGFITTNGGSVLSYGGVQLVTTIDSPTQLHATIPANLLKYSGALGVLVINPDPNGGASLPATFTVTPATTMTLAQISPGIVAPGSAPFTLTVTGTNFVNGATVQWNSTALVTTFVSATTLTAAVPATLVAQAGAAQVTVADPLGGTTGGLTFTIAIPNALPPPQPTAPPGGVPSPLPGSRQPTGPPLGNPNPLPPSR